MISATDVTVRIDEIELLAPVSLAAAPGTVCAVRGANGAGKSTLLQVIAGLLLPSDGSVTVFDRTPNARDRRFRSDVSARLHPPVLARDLTLHEQLQLVALSWAVPDAAERADELLEMWDIAQLRRRFPHELSSGQRQLFSLAHATARPARVLLLDEPEQRLDDARRALLVANLGRLRDQGMIVVAATHSTAVSDAADQVVRLG